MIGVITWLFFFFFFQELFQYTKKEVDYCFGVALHPCRNPTELHFYVETPHNNQTYQKNVTTYDTSYDTGNIWHLPVLFIVFSVIMFSFQSGMFSISCAGTPKYTLYLKTVTLFVFQVLDWMSEVGMQVCIFKWG